MMRAPEAAKAREIINRHVQCVLGREMSIERGDWCVPFVAALTRELHGIDLCGNSHVLDFRTEQEGLDRYRLGLAVSLARRLRELGWARCEPADAPFGAIGILRPTVGQGHCAGVSTGGGWFVVRFGMGVAYRKDGVVAVYARKNA